MQKKLIKRLKQQDEPALQKIMQQYTGYVYTILYNMAGGYCSREDMEELTADVFIRLWTHADALDEKQPISPYLAAIARNLAKNKLRSHQAKPDFCELEEDLASDINLPHELEWLDCMRQLQTGLDRLTPIERNLIIRYYFYGESLHDLAHVFSLTDSNAKIKLYRARKKLKQFLTERGFGNEA